MALVCRNLLKVPYANKMELVTGEVGLGNIILRTHVVEIADYIDFVQKGDLIITIGYVLLNNKDKWEEFIYQLCEKEIAAIAIDVERLHKDTVELIKRTCIECECPLFIMPVEMRTPDLQDSISRLIYEEKLKSTMAEQFFLELMYSNVPISLNKIKKAERYGFDSLAEYYFIDIKLNLDKNADIKTDSKCQQIYTGISGNTYTIFEENPIEQIKSILYGCIDVTDRKSYIIENGDNLTVLVSPEPFGINDMAEKIFKELRELDIEYIAGVSSKVIGLSDIYTCYEQALFSRKENKDINTCLFFEEFGIEAIIHNSVDITLLEAVCENILGPVFNISDEEKKNEIINTLSKYIENNCSYEETAKVLFCHSNTVRNRISDIETRLKIDHTKFNDMFNVKLALEIYKNINNKQYK